MLCAVWCVGSPRGRAGAGRVVRLPSPVRSSRCSVFGPVCVSLASLELNSFDVARSGLTVRGRRPPPRGGRVLRSTPPPFAFLLSYFSNSQMESRSSDHRMRSRRLALFRIESYYTVSSAQTPSNARQSRGARRDCRFASESQRQNRHWCKKGGVEYPRGARPPDFCPAPGDVSVLSASSATPLQRAQFIRAAPLPVSQAAGCQALLYQSCTTVMISSRAAT